jgi:hypothetical protein
MPSKTVGPKRYELFMEALDAYHDEPEYYEALEGATGTDIDSIAAVLFEYLMEWGGMARSFPVPRRPALQSALSGWLRDHAGELSEFSSVPIWSTDFDGIAEKLARLFDSMSSIGSGFGATARGKTLHVLLPALCVIWDAKYVRTPQGFDEDGHGYIAYLQSRRTILLEAIQDMKHATGLMDDETAVNWLSEEHRRRHARCRAPITKLLDEINYNDSAGFGTYLESVVARFRSSH